MSNVWTFPYRTRYYLTHPWKWFAQIGRNIRATYMRTKYGWTYSDVWDWDYWFMNVVPEMFRYLAEHGCAYPGYEPFETPEKWHDWLNHMANLIESGREEWQEEHNEYYEEYMDNLMKKWEPAVKEEDGFYHSKPRELDELDEKYFARAKELGAEGEKNVVEALRQIGQHFYQIWD